MVEPRLDAFLPDWRFLRNWRDPALVRDDVGLCLHQQNAGLVESVVAASADTNQWYRGTDLLLLRIQEPTVKKSTGPGQANTGVSSRRL